MRNTEVVFRPVNARLPAVMAVLLGWCAAVLPCPGQDVPGEPPPEEVPPAEAGGEAAAPETTPDAPGQAAGPDAPVMEEVREGFYQMRIGNSEAAAVAFRRALEKQPDSKRAMFGLGTALIAGEQFREAAAILSRAVELYPEDYYISNNLAWLYATAADRSVRDGERAVALAQQSLLQAPQDFHVWSTLAEAYFISAKYDQALRAATEALELAQKQGVGQTELADYERQLAKCRQAVQATTILE